MAGSGSGGPTRKARTFGPSDVLGVSQNCASVMRLSFVVRTSSGPSSVKRIAMKSTSAGGVSPRGVKMSGR
jgi:hypothetical protein